MFLIIKVLRVESLNMYLLPIFLLFKQCQPTSQIERIHLKKNKAEFSYLSLLQSGVDESFRSSLPFKNYFKIIYFTF